MNKVTKPSRSLLKTAVISRFFKEIFNKSLKCNRIGHKLRLSVFIFRKESLKFGVMTDFKGSRNYCKRCLNYFSEIETLEELETYHSVSMPSSCFQQIREYGYVIIKFL
jgi:hypothetical protein